MFNTFRITWLLIKMAFFCFITSIGILLFLYDYIIISKCLGLIHRVIHWMPSKIYGVETIDSLFALVHSKNVSLKMFLVYSSSLILLITTFFYMVGGWKILLWIIVKFNSRKSLNRESEMYNKLVSNLSIVIKQSNYRLRTALSVSDFSIRLFDSNISNAWVFANKVIVVTTGFMKQYGDNDDTIRGVLAHELGHVLNGDLDINTLSMTSNVLNMVLVVGYSKVKTGLIDKLQFAYSIIERTVMLYKFLLPIGFFFTGLYFSLMLMILIITLPLVVLLIMYALVSVLFVFPIDMAISRKAEYKADKIAANLGFSNGLLNFLYDDLSERGQRYGIKALLLASHPNSSDRIQRLENMFQVDDYQEEIVEERSSFISPAQFVKALESEEVQANLMSTFFCRK